MGNAAGVTGVLAAFVRPGLIVPHVIVPTIEYIDWQGLKRAGVEHIVIDKDNCVTLPLKDGVAPQVENAWQQLARAGFSTVLVVSNSAGSSDDPLAVGAENVARQLQQKVLAHPAKKPAMACAKQIIEVSTGVQEQGAFAVIGDRCTTDVILANRINRLLQKSGRSAISILTTEVLAREKLATRVLRTIETSVMRRLIALGIQPGATWWNKRHAAAAVEQPDWQTIASKTEELQNDALLNEFNAAEKANVEAAATAARLPFGERIRLLPSSALAFAFMQSRRVLVFLGQGWELILDGIRIGTKGRIGGGSESFVRKNRISQLNKWERRPYNARLLDRHGESVRHYATTKRAPSPRKGPPPTPAVRNGMSRATAIWLAMFGTFIVLPASLYAGVALKQWQNARREKAAFRKEYAAKQQAAAEKTTAPLTAESIASSAASQRAHETFRLRGEQMRLNEELKSVNTKLERVRNRMAESASNAATVSQ